MQKLKQKERVGVKKTLGGLKNKLLGKSSKSSSGTLPRSYKKRRSLDDMRKEKDESDYEKLVNVLTDDSSN